MARIPDGLPVLGSGRHRSPRKGACLMEYASLLAGERWSDSPSCTHPALATLARAVNDCSGDQARQGLLVVVPDIVHALGIDGEQARLGQRLARKSSLHALRVATGVRRRTLYVALLAAELACGPGSPAVGDLDRDAVRDLLRDPDPALMSAVRFVRHSPPSVTYDRTGVTKSLELAVVTIAELAGQCADELLRNLLVEAVAEVRGLPARTPAGPLRVPSQFAPGTDRELEPSWS